MLSDEIKKQIEIKVELDYFSYMTKDEIDKFHKAAKILKKYNLKLAVAKDDILSFVACKAIHCEGFVSLYEADLIVKELDEIDVFSTVKYSDGNFILSSKKYIEK